MPSLSPPPFSPVFSLLAFAAVVALIPLALWLLKRSPLGAAGGRAGTLRSVAVLPLSAQQRLVTVEVGSGEQRRWLVLGVTPTQITTLHTMLPEDISAAPTATQGGEAAVPFAQWLARLQQK